MQHQVPPQAAILQVIAGYWLSCADYAAARLKLADKVQDELAGYRAVKRHQAKVAAPPDAHHCGGRSRA